MEMVLKRRKGGAKRDVILNAPQFETPRRYMSEFGGCSSMGKVVRRMMGSQHNLANYNISGPVNAVLKVVQKQDKVSALGQRNIELSKYPAVLEGFSLNEDITFDSIVRNTLSWSLSRDTRSGHVDFPDLVPGVNFFPQTKQPMFSFVLSLGVVPDFFFNEGLGKFLPNENYESGWGATEITTPWKPVAEGSKAFSIGIEEVKSTPPDGAHSLILTIGIRFGVVYGGGVVEHAVQAGAAKVLAVR